jgi:hypothetical protein
VQAIAKSGRRRRRSTSEAVALLVWWYPCLMNEIKEKVQLLRVRVLEKDVLFLTFFMFLLVSFYITCQLGLVLIQLNSVVQQSFAFIYIEDQGRNPFYSFFQFAKRKRRNGFSQYNQFPVVVSFSFNEK